LIDRRRSLLGAAIVIVISAAAAARVALRDVPVLAVDRIAAAPDGPRPRGVFHVHSDSSHDGRTPAREQMAAAGDLGLDFVIFTEHDAQPVHASPSAGPLAIPGTEWSTTYGHLIYLGHAGLPPPESESRARLQVGLVDSLRARGALTILAHPASPRRPWTGRLAGIGGLEIASTSTDARVKGDPLVALLPGLFALPFNPELALAQLYRRDTEALAIWDDLDDPRVIGICGTDAHGWIDPQMNFRTWQVVFDPWADAPDSLAADAVVDRLATGRFICVAALLAEGIPVFSFGGVTVAGRAVPQGATVAADSIAALEIAAPPLAERAGTAAYDAGTTVTTVLLRDGVEVDRTHSTSLRHVDPAPGTYRVEVRVRVPGVLFGGHDVPAIYSNRIRVTR
jgi:hypothetical protein